LASISRSRITPTFSQRGGGLKILPQRVERDEPLHGIRSRRRWRKLHLAVDADTQEIAAVELTTDDVGDVSALPDLLDQIEHPIGSVTGDGAYDGDPVYDEVLRRHPTARVIIPPRSTAVLSEAGTTQRDEHLRSIEAHGRIGWQRSRWLWQAELGGNRDVSIQDRHRSASPRPDSAQSTDRSKNRLQRTQQDDQPRHADLHPYQMKREADGELQPNQSSCTNACGMSWVSRGQKARPPSTQTSPDRRRSRSTARVGNRSRPLVEFPPGTARRDRACPPHAKKRPN
jgi:Transposase DDE domain